MKKEIEDEALRLIEKFAYRREELLYSNSVRWISEGSVVKEEKFKLALTCGPTQLSSYFRTDPGSFYRELSESFIDYFKDDLDWNWVSGSSILSEPFIETHIKRLSWLNMLNGQKRLSEEFLEKHIDKWGNLKQCWVNLSHNYNIKLSTEFYLRHVDKIDDSLLLDEYTYSRMFPNVLLLRKYELMKKWAEEQ